MACFTGCSSLETKYSRLNAIFAGFARVTGYNLVWLWPGVFAKPSDGCACLCLLGVKDGYFVQKTKKYTMPEGYCAKETAVLFSCFFVGGFGARLGGASRSRAGGNFVSY